MKQATEAFEFDNGTVYVGQKLPDSHPAVARFPSKFTDIADVPADGDVAGQNAAMPNGFTTTGVGVTKPAQPGGDTSGSGSEVDTTNTASTTPPAAAGDGGSTNASSSKS